MADHLLDSSAFFRPTKGVRTRRRPDTIGERAAAVVPVLAADAAFSHVTAGALHGLPLSFGMELDERLHVLGPLDSRRMRRPGIVAHRALHPRETTTVDDLRVVGLADTWVDLGELVGRGKPAGLDDLIVIGDAVATRLKSVHPLRMALLRRVRPRGKATLLEALDEIRVGSASPRETLARLMFVRCGLPEPALNEPVLDAVGVLLGVADLLWEEQLVAGEYQGEEFHGSPEQRVKDARRTRRLQRGAGVSVEEIWRADMQSSAARRECVLRFASALGVARTSLDLSRADPRFFSTHAIDLAIQRQMERAARWAG
ncbi:MAG: hypothetical protein ABI336_08195 [Humibacillus sp.]